ncbi:MAG: hypothetical protein QMC67_11190 [Candidatus Wallbacteria bacterium]
MSKYYFCIFGFFLLFMISCQSVSTENNSSRLYQTSDSNEYDSIIMNGWVEYKSGKIDAALKSFESVITSGNDKYLLEKGIARGVYSGAGYCALALKKPALAINYFSTDIDINIESAVGAANYYFSKAEYKEAIKCFNKFDKIYTQQSPYSSINECIGFDVNLEAHKILFLSLYFLNEADTIEKQRAQYMFIADHTAEVGISPELEKIFSQTFKNL